MKEQKRVFNAICPYWDNDTPTCEEMDNALHDKQVEKAEEKRLEQKFRVIGTCNILNG